VHQNLVAEFEPAGEIPSGFCEGSESFMSRLAMSLIAYLVLGVLAFATLSDSRIRLMTLLILAMFAFKSWVRRKDVMHPDSESKSE